MPIDTPSSGNALMLQHAIMSEMSINWQTYQDEGGRTHTEQQCEDSRRAGAPEHCVLHNPSTHKLSGRTQILRSSGLIENVCDHGVGHPDPDSVAYFQWASKGYRTAIGIHGCDGCC